MTNKQLVEAIAELRQDIDKLSIRLKDAEDRIKHTEFWALPTMFTSNKQGADI